jgi:hypothetical protein
MALQSGEYDGTDRKKQGSESEQKKKTQMDMAIGRHIIRPHFGYRRLFLLSNVGRIGRYI